MAKTDLKIRIDENLAKQFNELCDDIGMSTSTAFCIFMKKTVREHGIPFAVSTETDPFYSAENMERLNRSIAQLETTGGTVHEVTYDD